MKAALTKIAIGYVVLGAVGLVLCALFMLAVWITGDRAAGGIGVFFGLLLTPLAWMIGDTIRDVRS